MTVPGTIPLTTLSTTQLDGLATTCPACPHPLDTHDAIDLRFCRATTAGSRTRGCTCSAGDEQRGAAIDQTPSR
jgi:hypothetical protein